jgi:arylsulfatase A-like enzyme
MRKTVYLLLLIILIWPAATCDFFRAEKVKPNIIILLVDALRADGLGCYGNPLGTSPYLDSYGKKGIIFKNAFTQSSHTRISIASLLTGLIPPSHGLRKAGSWGAEVKERKKELLNPDIVTIAEFLKYQGYITCAVTTNPQITEKFGFDQGFDDFYYMGKSKPLEVPAKKMNRTALDWLSSHEERPYFLYIHYIDVHAPYKPPEPYKKMFTKDIPKHRPLWADGPYRGNPSDEQIDYTRALYTAQIRYWDDEFRKFMKELEIKDLLQDTVVVVTSDHGDEFYEHGGFGHGFTCYEEMLDIPLIMVWPGVMPEGVVREDESALIDLFPTLSKMAGLDISRMPLQGRDLFKNGWEGKPGIFSKKKDDKPRVLYTETYRGKVPRCIRVKDEKIIRNQKNKAYEYYRLDNDPGEKKNLYAKDKPEVEKLVDTLGYYISPVDKVVYPDELIEALAAIEKVEEDDSGASGKEINEALKSLGYIDD